MPRTVSVARDEHAGRLEPLRLGVRYAATSPDRSDHGVAGAMEWAEGRLSAGVQRLGPFELGVSADLAGEEAEFQVTVRNYAETELHLESVVLGFRWAGVDAHAVRFLKNGWQSWSYTGGGALDREGEAPFPSGPWMRGLYHVLGAPPADREGWHESALVSVACDTEGRACLVGLLEGGLGSGLVYWRRDDHGVRVELEIQLEVPVPAGGSLELEPVRVALGTDENRLLETFAEELGRRGSARTGAPLPTGWCSWYQFFHDVTEQDLLRNLDALTGLRSQFAVDVVQLDDGFQHAIGDWLETNEKFPRGLAPLAAEIRAAGFRPGIWTAPFCVVAESRLYDAHPEWLLGSHVAKGEPHRGLMHPSWTKAGWVYALDPTREEVVDHLLRTFAGLVGMGFSYLKLDFLYVAAMQAEAFDPTQTRAARLRRGLDAIRRGAGDEAFLLGCGCPLGPAVGVVDAMRIGPDVAPHWGPPSDAWPGIEHAAPNTGGALRSILARAWMHRRLWINDPDCLMARTEDTELDEAEVDALAGAIAVTGGMTVVSDDLPALGEADLERVRRTVALAREIDAAGAQGAARATDLVAEEAPSGAVARAAEATWVYALNSTEHATERSLATLEERGGPTEPTVLSGAAPGAASLRLGRHESSLLRFSREVALGVFCDYDGTFAVQDVGSTLAKTYASEGRAALWERLSRGELSAWEYNMELLDGLELSEEKLDRFLKTVEPMPGAHELVAWCEERGVPFRVLSDGFDRNLDRLQELHGVRFAYDANHLWYDAGRWRLAPGAPDASCGCGTGVCKRGRIALFRRHHPGATVVHIGNGRVSDLCASEAADVVFAKDTLAEELDTRSISFEPFDDLHQVTRGLERVLVRLQTS
ncbi:MAG: hypothetical protein GY937_17710 [bacterium]|nr:hypothetical protein [bacterium]